MRLSTTNSPSGRKRTSRLMALCLTAGLALAGCSAGTAAEEEAPEQDAAEEPAEAEVDPDAIIEAGISYTLGTGFDPMTTTGAVTVAANWHTMEGLTEIDPVTREVYAALATDIPTKIDDSHWEATLRDGAVFHNGDPVTVEDVVFSFERVLNPESKSLYAGFIGFVESVQAKDDSTVTITLKYPFSLVPERLSVVKIVPQAVVEADYEAFNALPTGTGPYKITSAVADDKITFERFDDYSGPRPAQAAGMNWNLLSDAAARVTAMRSGTIQAMEDVPYIDADGLAQEVDVESVQAFGVLFMMFNTDKAPFDDKRVRQAFFYAIDTQKLIDNGLLGNASAASSFLQESHANYNEAETVYAYDPEKARELLDEAGVDTLDITLLTTDTGWVADVAPLIKEDLDAIGISTTLDIAQSSAQYSKVDAGEMDVMVAPGDPSVFGNDPDLLMRWWYGDNVWPQSRYRWSDTPEFAELTSLLDAGAEASGDEQQAIWNDAFDLISDEVPLYPLLHRQLPTAWDSEALTNFRPVPLTGLSFLDVGVAK